MTAEMITIPARVARQFVDSWAWAYDPDRAHPDAYGPVTIAQREMVDACRTELDRIDLPGQDASSIAAVIA